MPERILWRELKQLKPHGFHFRRQVSIGPYFADFICHAAKLAIEVDGHLHGREAAQTHDEKRTEFFNAEGYQVMRFTNSDVVKNIEGVMAVVIAKLDIAKSTPTPNPSPQGGGERG